MMDLISDDGRLAAAKGYDAVEVTTSHYLVVLNRIALRISRTRHTSQSVQPLIEELTKVATGT